MRRWIASFLCCLMVGTGVCSALAQELPALPLVENTAAQSGMIRVWLASIKTKTSFTVTVHGDYTINGDTSRKLANGSTVTVDITGGTVYLTQNGARTSMGNSLTLKRHSGGAGYNALRVQETLVPTNYYPCDLTFTSSGGQAYLIANIFLEDYLMGVLPYEMDNSFPLEALKAQAVAARTYALASRTSGTLYDVTDTTNSQVFRGVSYTKTNCIQAVNDTWGVVLTYGGKPITAYFSASNGGQTDTNDHAWGGAKLAYFAIADDPYDLGNTASVKKSYYFYRSPLYGTSTSGNTMLGTALAGRFGGTAYNYAIEEIVSMALISPKYAAPSRLYTKLQTTVRYNGGQVATLDISLFPTVQSALSLQINTTDNELYTLEEEAAGFRLTARRFGHGVGLSQRGAEEMAKQGILHTQILGFYYPNVSRVRMNFTRTIAGPVAGGAASPETTPRPQESPGATATPQVDTAQVKLTVATDNLNLRAAPSTVAQILSKIPNGAMVTVLERGTTWSRVSYGSMSGYVMNLYLIFAQPVATATPVPTSIPTVAPTYGTQSGVVSVASGTLNMRQAPDISAAVILRIPNGTTLPITHLGEEWCGVTYQGQSGFVLRVFLTLTAQVTAQPTATPEATFTLPPTLTVGYNAYVVTSESDAVNMRATANENGIILERVPRTSAVMLLDVGPVWCQVRYNQHTGYIATAYLAPYIVNPKPTVTPQHTQVQGTPCWVKVQSGSVYLRTVPSTNGEVLARLAHGTQMTLFSRENGWCRVMYGTTVGYMAEAYVTTTAPVGTTQGTPTVVPTAQTTNALNAGRVHAPITATVTVRTDASESSMMTGILRDKEVLDVLEYKGTHAAWLKIRCGTVSGYLPRSQVTLEYALAVVTVNDPGTRLIVRSAPSPDSNEVTKLDAGTLVTVLSSDGTWARIRLANHTTGYVAETYLRGI